MGFAESVGLRRAALGARSASAVGSKPGLPLPPLHRGVQPRARPRPGQERRWVGARWRGARAAGSGFGGGHRGRSPPPSRRLPALLGRGAGGGRGAARGSGARGAAGASGVRTRWSAPPPGRSPPTHGPGAERPAGHGGSGGPAGGSGDLGPG